MKDRAFDVAVDLKWDGGFLRMRDFAIDATESGLISFEVGRIDCSGVSYKLLYAVAASYVSGVLSDKDELESAAVLSGSFGDEDVSLLEEAFRQGMERRHERQVEELHRVNEENAPRIDV